MSALGEWDGIPAFVTGHTGFKGSWLTIWLHRLGARIAGYSLRAAQGASNFAASNVRSLLAAHYEGDVRDLPRLRHALAECQPQVIFHLAAQALVPEGYCNPRETFETNVMGTVNVLEAVRRLQAPCVVILVTSDKCYENLVPARPHCESDPMGGHDPYSASKGAAEIAIAAYRRTFFPAENVASHGVRVASVRAGNVIGGGDWANDRIVPDTIRALHARRPVLVRHPRSIRPWQHVLEPLCGYLTLAAGLLSIAEPVGCDAWNFGPCASQDATVQELVERLIGAWGKGRWQDVSGRLQFREELALRLDGSKAARELGWKPRWGFEETVRRTVEWYRAFYRDTKRTALDLCWRDIEDYEALLPAEREQRQLEPASV